MSAKSPSSFAVNASVARSPLLYPHRHRLRDDPPREGFMAANILPSIPHFNEGVSQLVTIHNLRTVAPRYGELLALLVYLTQLPSRRRKWKLFVGRRWPVGGNTRIWSPVPNEQSGRHALMRGVTCLKRTVGYGGEGGRSAEGGSQRCNIRTMIIIQNRRQNPLRGVLATRRRRSSVPPRAGGSICRLQRTMTSCVASNIWTDPTSIDAGSRSNFEAKRLCDP